ncbi:hypothetical protein [uncultured Phenylobacterium sp.]|uniref:hypothetical protein n=1 Tax=uncultured Phenylobacterium sp. TaxID=349273 RepID=UPI0025FD58E6|nr:hypothetical protein [uncultured Phenylobacterium sp.]
MKLRQILLCTVMASGLLAGATVAQETGGNTPTETPGEPPAIEAPKAAGQGEATADGGGSDSEHIAWTVGSGPGNDTGLYKSTTASRNALTGTVNQNTTSFVGASNTISQESTIDAFSSVGQASISLNSGQHAVVNAGSAVNFVANQGSDNPQTVLEGGILSNFAVDETVGADGSSHLVTSLEQEASDNQVAVDDGTASGSGGGKNTVHIAHTVGSGTGNDVGFDESSLVSSNDVLGSVTSNVLVFAATEGANELTQLASLTNVNSTGQVSIAQNAGNNSIVTAGTSVGFIANFTSSAITPISPSGS